MELRRYKMQCECMVVEYSAVSKAHVHFLVDDDTKKSIIRKSVSTVHNYVTLHGKMVNKVNALTWHP